MGSLDLGRLRGRAGDYRAEGASHGLTRGGCMQKQYVLLWILGAVLGTSGCSKVGNGAAAPYVVLNEQGSPLREDFNRAKGSVRLIFIVDPTCPGCLKGM